MEQIERPPTVTHAQQRLLQGLRIIRIPVIGHTCPIESRIQINKNNKNNSTPHTAYEFCQSPETHPRSAHRRTTFHDDDLFRFETALSIRLFSDIILLTILVSFLETETSTCTHVFLTNSLHNSIIPNPGPIQYSSGKLQRKK